MRQRWAMSLACLGALSLLSSCTSRPVEAELREAMIAYIDACARGDLDAFRRLRAREEVDRVEKLLKEKGKALSPKSIMPRDPESARRLGTLPAVQVRIEGSTACLALLDENPPNERQVKPSEAKLTVVVFTKEDAVWKVIEFTTTQLPMTDGLKKGDLPEQVMPEEFRLPQ